METPLKVARGMFVAGKFGPQVHGGPAALSVERPHREIKRAGIHIRADGKRPTLPGARDFEIVRTWGVKSGEVGGFEGIAGICISGSRAQLVLKYRGIVARALDRETRGGSADHGDFPSARGITHLVNLDA